MSKVTQAVKEAALAMFETGMPPSLVAEKLDYLASKTAVHRWFTMWAEMRGLPAHSTHKLKRIRAASRLKADGYGVFGKE